MKQLAILVAVLVPVLAAAEETLVLKDGSSLKGTIVSQENGVVTFDSAMGTVQIPKSKISRIEYSESAPLSVEASTDVWKDVPEASAPATPRAVSSPRRAARAPGAELVGGLQITPKLGWHQYSGDGWSEFEGDWRHAFDGPTVALAIAGRVATAPEGPGLDLVGTMGWYGGEHRECDDNGFERACAELQLSNLYLDFGPRAVIPAGKASFYAQIGGGMYQSSVAIDLEYEDEDGFEDNYDDTKTRSTSSFHALFGLGFEATPVTSFSFEAKWVTANGKFEDATESWDMGGYTFMTGLSFRPRTR